MFANSLNTSSIFLSSSSAVQLSGSCSNLPLNSSSIISTTTSNLPVTLQGYSSGPIKIEQNLIGMNSSTLSGNIVLQPRSIMVEVDSMLHDNGANKRPRKYKKRTPELNPETGEIIKKPRKKGSGRKSKKELLMIQAAKESPLNSIITNATRPDDITPITSPLNLPYSKAPIQIPKTTNFHSSPISNNLTTSISVPPSVSMFSKLAVEERNIVSLLCKIKTSRSQDILRQSKVKILSFLEASKLESDKIVCFSSRLN